MSYHNTISECATAYWAVAPERGELRQAALIDPGNTGKTRLLVRNLYSAISRGTEIKVARGEVPPSEYQRMRCPHQEGDFPFPVKYGYCCVGVVEGAQTEPSADDSSAWMGARVFALHPHQTRYRLAPDAVRRLPPELPPERAILAANMETALNAVWDSGASAGDRITIVGAGTLGLLTARLLTAMPGTEVLVIDRFADRRDLAERFGAHFAIVDAAGGVGSGRAGGAIGADIVINASGSAAGLALALECAGREARVVEMSWLGGTATLPLDGAFHSQRLTIRSSQVGSIPPARAPRWDYARRMAKALELLAGFPELDALISHEIAFDELPSAMAKLCRGWPEALTIRVRYPG